MRKVELFLAILALITLVMTFLPIPGGGFFMVLVFSLFSMFYFIFGFSLFFNPKFSKVFTINEFEDKTDKRIVLGAVTGIIFSISLVAILFNVMIWPGGMAQLGVSFVGLVIVMGIGFIRFSQTKSPFYRRLLTSSVIIGVFVTTLLIIPEYTILEVKFSGHPEYVEALKAAKEQPENDSLWKKVEDERARIYSGEN